MAKRIPVSFKENKRDMKLYDYVNREEDKSSFVKKAIEFYVEYLNSKQVPITINSPVTTTDFDDNENDGIGEIFGI